MKKAEMCIVETQAQAEAVMRRLCEIGFAPQEVSILFPSQQGAKDFTHVRSSKAPEGAVVGVWSGGILGSALGLLAGLGAFVIPGFQAFTVAGPVMSALSGAAAFGAIGGFVGALVGTSMPEYEAKLYEGRVRGGGLLIAVHTENLAERRRAASVFRQMGGRDIAAAVEAPVPGEAH